MIIERIINKKRIEMMIKMRMKLRMKMFGERKGERDLRIESRRVIMV